MRGNCRTSGELRRKEGGNVFGLGSRTPISITLLVKNPIIPNKKAEIFYRDIGDYYNQNEKLQKIKELGSILNPAMKLSSISPNEAYDWLNQRDSLFETFIPIGCKENKITKTVFNPFYSCGVKTNRDSWVYNFSMEALNSQMSSMVSVYNENVEALRTARELNPNISASSVIKMEPTRISWNRSLRNDYEKLRNHNYDNSLIRTAVYRPFVKMHYYFDKNFNDMLYQIPKLFPTPQSRNLVICVSGIGGKTFSALMVNMIPDLHILESGTQCFPLYYYNKNEKDQLSLFDQIEDDYIRREGISDFILERVRILYGPKINKEEIFYYVYGLLHAKDYCKRFEADLTKMLPRIYLVENTKLFKAISTIGRELAEIHIGYETVEKWPEVFVSELKGKLVIEKMKFAKHQGNDDKRCIILNNQIKVENIPLRAYDYIINGKSAIEWLMERYQYTENSVSKLKNDPNAWGREHENPEYILDILLRIITVSMKTLQLVEKLPVLDFITT